MEITMAVEKAVITEVVKIDREDVWLIFIE